MPELAGVVVDLVTAATNKVFTYSVPPELAGRVRCGARVRVPFGHRWLTGYVVPEVAAEVEGVRPIAAVLAEGLFTPASWELARWLSERYVCHLMEALRLVLPPGPEKGPAVSRLPQRVFLACDAGAARALKEQLAARAPAQVRLLEALLAAPEGLERAELLKQARASAASLKALMERGAVGLRQAGQAGPGSEAGAARSFAGAEEWPEPTPDQARALAAITAALGNERPQPFLLYGVTGSGKTEVYLRALAAALERGRGGIVLVPEIALTPQTLARFSGRFGSEVAVLHSALGPRVRYAEWERVRQGKARVVIGARSAVFAPLARPGIIIVDEEHEPAYKQEESPRYLAREVARWRAEREGALLILGSATPAVETYFRAREGRYRLLELPERIAHRALPAVQVVDMRAELMAGNRSIFSRELKRLLAEVVSRGEQAILFLNRRGYSTFVLCRQCGLVATCPRCELALTLHRDSGRLLCHHCGFSARPYRTCPRCGSPYVREFGCGTERVAAEAQRLLPQARVLRLDGETAARRGAHDRILGSFDRQEADILVGTQMVAKGLDFARVSLVGIVSADQGLHLPDPYAAERTFQLLEQVAGRAGRAEVPGRVILQTYAPDHPCIQYAGRHDYPGFYERELRWRERHRYPPFAEVILVRAVAPAEDAARQLLAALVSRLGSCAGVAAEGPAPCPLLKAGGDYRWQVIFKGTDLTLLRRRLVGEMAALAAECQRLKARLSVDVDPLSYL